MGYYRRDLCQQTEREDKIRFPVGSEVHNCCCGQYLDWRLAEGNSIAPISQHSHSRVSLSMFCKAKLEFIPCTKKPLQFHSKHFAAENQNQNYTSMCPEIKKKNKTHHHNQKTQKIHKPKMFRHNCQEFGIYLFVWWWSVSNKQGSLLSPISLPTPIHRKTLICQAGSKTKKKTTRLSHSCLSAPSLRLWQLNSTHVISHHLWVHLSLLLSLV